MRDLNTKHVHYLEKSYAECQGADFVVHVGHLISGDIEKVATEGSCIIETIGGNHSRAAVKLLYQKGARDPFLTMTIYHQLTDFEAMRLGFHHNAIPGRNRKLTFVEKVHLVKRYVHTNNIYKNLQAIAGKTVSCFISNPV